ncbi:MAG: multidrug transporter [Chloroflexota bacterium]
MRRIVLRETSHISPFNEPARDLRVQNKPLWLWQRDLLGAYTTEEREYDHWEEAYRLETEPIESFVHRDNLFFNEALVAEFITRGRASKKPRRLAFETSDTAIREHVRPLTRTLHEKDGLYLADIWYLPGGLSESTIAEPLVIDTEPLERGYYHIPPYMASEFGDLVYFLPRKAFVLIENWVHLFIADILFGVFARGTTMEADVEKSWTMKLQFLFRSLLEQKQVLSNSNVVKIGNRPTIDPSAIIRGYTSIGDNVTIGPGVVIDNCLIGNNVNISQGSQLSLSVVSDGCFLPFRSALFMTTVMENTMIAQNTCLQLCVVGRDSVIGAGTTFTDLNLLSGPIRTLTLEGGLEDTGHHVLGGCIGHHCRLSSGLVIYAARTIESDVVLFAKDDRHYITHNVAYEESDHHRYRSKYPYPRLYPREGE